MRMPVVTALLLAAPLSAQARLLRFPDLHGDHVVFTHGGDLWRAPLRGGTATRLTAAKGVELFARFSPDGNWLAFTGQIDGDEQVYVMPASGGEPQRLTSYPARGPLPDRWGYDHQVYGWTPDGSAVLFRGLDQSWDLASSRLFTVALPAHQKTRGALPVPLRMPVAGAGEFSPDGKLIVYSPLFRDFRTWKRYEGGWATDLYVFDPVSETAENITGHARTDRDPMWLMDRIWFASDRTGTLNLWSYDPKSRKVWQETFGDTWDLRWPSAGGPGEERIVYEKGGELCWFDCRTRQEQPIPITVPDDALLTRPAHVDAGSRIDGYSPGPGARRTAFAARGEIVTVPLEHGDPRVLAPTPDAHDKHPAFSPDGSQIAFVSDRSGEEQIWLIDHLGEQPPRQLTQGLKAMLYAPRWAPDGKSLAFGDKDGVLRIVDVASGELTVIADEDQGQIHDHVWSPCSTHLAFTLVARSGLRGIHIWSRADGQVRMVSKPLNEDRQPQWDGKGERLFFLGLRGFQPRLSTTHEWDYQIDRAIGVFALALRADLGPWLPVRSDEAIAPPAAAKEDAAATPPAPVRIDFDGLADRVEPLPIALDNWNGLAAVDQGLLLVKSGGSYYGRETDRPTSLHCFGRDKRELVELAADVSGYALAADGKKLVFASKGKYLVADAGPAGKDGQKTLPTDKLQVERVPAAEWRQIFHEVWRRYRDFFYVPNMHGYDWEALRERYLPLVAHVRHRSDLNYVLGEMIAELNVGHAYIAGGDIDRPTRVPVALPGAVLQFDRTVGRYRIARILRGEQDDTVYRAPLTAVGVQVKEGEFLLAIDGQELLPETDPYALLRGKAGRQVRLSVNGEPTLTGARTIAITPITDEHKLYYHAFVQRNRARTAQLSGGKLGYLHLPDMGEDGIREFIKQYYGQLDREGLVIDDRYNGGGNVSQMVLNRLRRQLLMCTFGRTSGFRPYPQATFQGHLVCLLNESSASDGDIFPAMFRRSGLGPLIGKRSWGGIIGITSRGPLLDGGVVNVPEFGNTEPGPTWTIEGHGVDPDIVVDNDVHALLQDRDPQLEKGVEVLLEKIAKDPRPWPVAPPAPIKTERAR
ncbi:MAG: PD40 domain-containing protein [Planctomycetes bacterium]|nr:PD40 domain-containing protein [Planctomycetota bacterium]